MAMDCIKSTLPHLYLNEKNQHDLLNILYSSIIIHLIHVLNSINDFQQSD